ncbi:thioredoxin family protein [uncultured Acetobacteroides sp.]|uniref:thioredoxin family protein n=1 Tax=uncultured Acetobacteroides sp. TaxID=1760811 RepID=UPI0029F45DAB|nr:thioredoxin family protein [uncultured Acetobacteroides sp.]
MKKHYILVLGFLLASIGANAQWLYSYEDAVKVAKASGKLILIDFSATWCGPCKAMESDVWSDPAVKAQMGNVVMVKVDIDSDRETALRYSVQAVPNIVVAMPNGDILEQEVGYQNSSFVISMLKSYSYNLKDAYEILFSGEKASATDLLKLGDAYAEAGVSGAEATKHRFFNYAEKTYKKASKLADKASNVQVVELSTIRTIGLSIDRGKPQKALDALAKEVKEATLTEAGKLEFLAVNMRAYAALSKKDEAKKYLQQLQQNPNAMALLEKYKNEVKSLN